ncbi:MAG: hypothetical protein IJ774_14455 [Selenomonadaceae bacterium]|nr:hypothetical protein [Selenomonadaceae bacterium]
MTITVKIVPRDGSWRTAYELIRQIAATKPDCELNFVVEDVFSADKKIPVGGDSIVVFGNSQDDFGNQFNVGGRK